MGIQEFLTLAVVASSTAFLAWKFVVAPRTQKSAPHVATQSLVRRARKKKLEQAHHDGACH